MGGAAAAAAAAAARDVGGSRDQRGGRQPRPRGLRHSFTLDRRAAETKLAVVRRDKDRLASRVKTLERDLATARKATGGRPLGQTGGGEPESPTAERGVGAPNPAGVRYLLAGSQAWHAQGEAAAGQMSAVATGLRMALKTSGQAVQVTHVAPDLAWVTAAHEELGRQYPPPLPHGSGDGCRIRRGGRAELPGLRWPELCSRGVGPVALPLTSGPPVPSNLHGCYLYIFVYEYMYMQVLPATPPPPAAWAV